MTDLHDLFLASGVIVALSGLFHGLLYLLDTGGL